jgi:acyl-CoA reductase-like NAD-dependent aldehyde dehydrogenase
MACAFSLNKHRVEVEALLVQFNGKLRVEAANEVSAAINAFQYYAGLSRNLWGRVAETDTGCWSMLPREPLGVAAVIVPWNAPVSLMVRSLAPALAAGCTAVVKHAAQTSPATSLVLRLIADSGLPRGVLNSIVETGAECSQYLCETNDVDVISFTGSSKVGKDIALAAARSCTRLSLELGGKGPAVVFSDADLDLAIPAIVRHATVMAGQMCTAITRVLVERQAYRNVANAVVEHLRQVRVGAGDDPSSTMGPVIDHRNRDRILATAQRATNENEVLLNCTCPGGSLAAGAFITPGVVAVEDPTSFLVQEEIFGPLITVEPFVDESDCVSLANATRYGLSASVWSTDLSRAKRVAAKIRAGTVWINSHNRHAAETETGGYRESGRGRLYGVEGLNDFLQTKHVYFETQA